MIYILFILKPKNKIYVNPRTPDKNIAEVKKLEYWRPNTISIPPIKRFTQLVIPLVTERRVADTK